MDDRRQDSFEEAMVLGSRLAMPSPPKEYEVEVRTFTPGRKVSDAL